MARKVSLLIVGMLCLYTRLTGQCPTSQINLTSQAQVNAFPTDYPGCTHLLNSLYISGTDITSLIPLSTINIIDGFLTVIDNTNLTSLAGLDNVDSIWAVDISNNPLLPNLAGLHELENLGLYLNIDNNDAMLNLYGLIGLVSIGPNGNDGYLSISNNQLLNDLTGGYYLDSLAFLNIASNPSLPDFDGLGDLKKVDTLIITGNSSIQNLNGFDNLSKVSNLRIVENPTLTNLQGVPLLTHLDTLYAEANIGLVNLSGLENITNLKKCYIGNNESLSNLTGIDNITNIDLLFVVGNQTLLNFTGLTDLASVIFFYVNNNQVLHDFSGLNSLSQVAIFYVQANPALVEIDDIGAMVGTCQELTIIFNDQLLTLSTSVPVNVSYNVDIYNNPLLEDCCILLDIAPSVDVTIFGNAPSCNSIPAVQQYCDADGDNLYVGEDNCPLLYNPLQQDSDADGVGNGCDNCPLIANPDQADTNDNFIGNACEIPEAGKIGLGNTSPKSQLDVSGGDLYINNTQRGIILKNYLGDCFRLIVDESGGLSTVEITCPD